MVIFDTFTEETRKVDFSRREQLRKELAARKLEDYIDHPARIFVFMEGGQIVGVSNEEQVLRGDMDEGYFRLTPSLFLQARDVFRADPREDVFFYVLDEADRVVGGVRYQKNSMRNAWQVPEDFWAYEFEHGVVNEDLLDRANGYLFQTVEEYSYAIAMYLSKHHPERDIYFYDPDGRWASLSALWQGSHVHFMRGQGGGLPAATKWLFIDSMMQNTNGWMPEYITLQYTSLKVMFSMLWGTHPAHLGSLFPEKKIALVDFACPSGLVDILISICTCATYLERKGFVPVIDLSRKDCCSYWEEGINVWDELFQPWSEVCAVQARQSSHVIRASEELGWWTGTWHWNPYHWENFFVARDAQYLGKKTKLTVAMWQYVLEHAPQELLARLEAVAAEETQGEVQPTHEEKKQRILGVKLRGTDYNRGQAGGASIETMVAWCRSLLMSGMYDSLYLATEDQSYFERFQREFPGKICFIQQPRTVDDADKNIAQNLSRYGSKIEMAKLYVSDVRCLSVCDDLITNRYSGAYRLATAWRHRSCGFCKVIGDDELAPASPKVARIFLATGEGETQTLQIENLAEAEHPFQARRAEGRDFVQEPCAVIEPQGNQGVARMKVHWGGTKLHIKLSSAVFAPAGRSIPQWVTYTSFRVNGQEVLQQPASAWHEQPVPFDIAVQGGHALELEVHWAPYAYAPEELARLLRYRLPRGGTPQRPAIPAPPMGQLTSL